MALLAFNINKANAQSPCTPDKSDPGPAPTGHIDVSPNYPAGSGGIILDLYHVAVGNTLTLSADGVGDQDCCCGKLVDDVIDITNKDDLNWILEDGATGTIDRQNKPGPTTAYTTPPATTSAGHVDTVDLKIKDEASSASIEDCTIVDFQNLTTIDSIQIEALLPDTVDSSDSTESSCVGSHGKMLTINDKITSSIDGSVDFSGYTYGEKHQATLSYIDGNTCSLSTSGVWTGGSGTITGNQLAPANPDIVTVACSTTASIANPCQSTWQLQYYYIITGATAKTDFFTRTYEVTSTDAVRDHVSCSFTNDM